LPVGFLPGAGGCGVLAPRRRRLELVEQIANLGFERQDARFVSGDASIPLAASRTLGDFHAAKLPNSHAISCASSKTVNGYIWKAEQSQLDPDQLVFIDETWATTNNAAIRPLPERPASDLSGSARPLGDDYLRGRLANSWPDGADGPMNGDRFVKYVETVLIPTLKPGNIVILDNLSCTSGARSWL
jgi:hypothetical protein